MAAPTSVEDYMAVLPEASRAVLQQLRTTIRAAAPAATEVISYAMPAFKVDGRLLVSYAAFRHHYSLFPASEVVRTALGDELTPYFTGKGTIRFHMGRPVPAALVEKIVKVRLEEVAARGRR